MGPGERVMQDNTCGSGWAYSNICKDGETHKRENLGGKGVTRSSFGDKLVLYDYPMSK